MAMLSCAIISAGLPHSVAAAELSQVVIPADTSSPRATLNSFLDACNQIDSIIKSDPNVNRSDPAHLPLARKLLDCMDTSQLSDFAHDHESMEAAICLKEILDRLPIPPQNEIPDIEAVMQSDSLEVISRWHLPGTRFVIARIEEGEHRHEYLITAGTVARATHYYQDVKSLAYRTTGPKTSPGFYHWYLTTPGTPFLSSIVSRLPDWASEDLLGMAIWKLVGLLVGCAMTLFLLFLIYHVHRIRVQKWKGVNLFRYALTLAYPVLALLLLLSFKQYLHVGLTLRGSPLYVVDFITSLLTLMSIVVLVWSVINRVAEAIIALPSISPKGLDAQIIRILSRLTSFVVAAGLLLEGGRYLGIPLTTLLASAGVGGLATALAAQDTLKTLFGTLNLMFDKPFRAGDRIVFNNYDGHVEEIGLRSTRLRLLNGHLLTLPNDELAKFDIENISRRSHIRRFSEIHLPLDNTRSQVALAVQEIKSVLKKHDCLDPDSPSRVFFHDFTPNAFVIHMIYWYTPPDRWKFHEFNEQVNLEIFAAFDRTGIQFSLPFRASYTSLESTAQPLEIKMVER